MGKIRRMAAEFQGQFQEAMREAEMADLKKEVDDDERRGDEAATSIRSRRARRKRRSAIALEASVRRRRRRGPTPPLPAIAAATVPRSNAGRRTADVPADASGAPT